MKLALVMLFVMLFLMLFACRSGNSPEPSPEARTETSPAAPEDRASPPAAANQVGDAAPEALDAAPGADVEARQAALPATIARCKGFKSTARNGRKGSGHSKVGDIANIRTRLQSLDSKAITTTIGAKPVVRAEVDATLSRPEALKTAITGASGKIRRCFQAQLQTDSTLAGKLSMTMTISRAGEVGDICVAADSLQSDAVTHCIAKTLVTLDVGEGDEATVTFPFVFAVQ